MGSFEDFDLSEELVVDMGRAFLSKAAFSR